MEQDESKRCSPLLRSDTHICKVIHITDLNAYTVKGNEAGHEMH